MGRITLIIKLLFMKNTNAKCVCCGRIAKQQWYDRLNGGIGGMRGITLDDHGLCPYCRAIEKRHVNLIKRMTKPKK
jgi:hypothetical protein